MVLSQTAEINSTKSKLIDAAKEIMEASGTCALITLDEQGRARVRAMENISPENNLTVWFVTNPKSRKVNQIKNDPRVTLYYLDSDASGYVMIHGSAELVNSQAKKEKLWRDEWDSYYPDKKSALLIKVSPIWMEISSSPRGIYGDSITWQPPKVVLNEHRQNSSE
jgi:general stress protein 26